MRAMAWWAVALALVGGLAGCSDDGGDDAGRPGTTEAAQSSTSATLEPCPFVTTEAVAEAFGLPVELLGGGADACDFTLGDAATLLVAAGQPDGTREEDCAPDSIVAAEAEVADGVAWACLVDEVPTGVLLVGEAAVALTVTGEVAPAASRDALTRLLPRVTLEG